MDNPIMRVRTVKTVEVVIPLPADTKEFYMWEHYLRKEFEARTGRAPDRECDFQVVRADDELIATFQVDDTTEAVRPSW